jgi:predicted aconitase with swiveling domain
MAKKAFQGRPLLPGDLKGEALVSHQPFNTSGSYLDNMFAGVSDRAPCTDADNPDLYEKELANCILCTTQTIGSTLGGAALMGVTEMGVGPKALLFANHIDAVSAAGVFSEEIWKGKRIITIDMLGGEFLAAVNTGDPISIHADGTVEVG